MRLSAVRRLGVYSVLLLAACADPERELLAVPWTVHVETEHGEDLPGVDVFFDEKPVGTTGIDGRLTRMIQGAHGDPTRVSHRCPAGYRAGDDPTTVRIRRYRLTDTPVIMEVALTCESAMRTAAFVIRTTGVTHLPISLNGEVVAETSALGVAHFSRAGTPGTEYLVELDARGSPGVRPPHTSHRFVLGKDHALFVVDQSFAGVGLRRRPRARRRPIIKIE